MRSLILFFLYSLSIAYESDKSEINVKDGSDGWGAGDCLDPYEDLAQVNFDCGSSCYSDYQSSSAAGGTMLAGTSNYYGNCLSGDYSCNLAYVYCYKQTSIDVDSCIATIDGCQYQHHAYAFPGTHEDDPEPISDEEYMQCFYDAVCTDSGLSNQDVNECQTDIDEATSKSVKEAINEVESRSRKSMIMLQKPILNAQKFQFNSGIVLSALDDGSAIYCYHTHLYSFMYGNVQPAGGSISGSFSAMGWVLSGSNGKCKYESSKKQELVEDVEYSTSGDSMSSVCGYYAEYEWEGSDEVYFEIQSNLGSYLSILSYSMVVLITLLI